MFNSLEYFKKENYSQVDGVDLKLAGGGITLPVTGTGSAVINGENNVPIRFENALYVPKLSKNLIARCILLQDQINISTNGPHVELRNQDVVLLKGKFNNNLMEFEATPYVILLTKSASRKPSAEIIHFWFSHTNHNTLNLMANSQLSTAT